MAPSEQVENARLLIRQGKLDEAIARLQELLRDYDTDPALHDAIGSAYFLLGKNELALQHFERILRLSVAPGKAFINLGAVYNRMGQHHKAVESIRKGLLQEKRSVEGFYNLGIAHRKLHQYAMAVNAFKEALRHDAQFVEAYYQLGSVYLDQGLPEQAIAQFQKALALRPNFDRARAGLDAANRASSTARQAISPFGRLVDTTTNQKQVDEKALRPMTNEETDRDRARIHELSREIDNAASEWVVQLKEELDAAISYLDKQLILGVGGQNLADAVERFNQALFNAESGRRKLRRKVLELVAHEELQHSPLEPSSFEI